MRDLACHQIADRLVGDTEIALLHRAHDVGEALLGFVHHAGKSCGNVPRAAVDLAGLGEFLDNIPQGQNALSGRQARALKPDPAFIYARCLQAIGRDRGGDFARQAQTAAGGRCESTETGFGDTPGGTGTRSFQRRTDTLHQRIRIIWRELRAEFGQAGNGHECQCVPGVRFLGRGHEAIARAESRPGVDSGHGGRAGVRPRQGAGDVRAILWQAEHGQIGLSAGCKGQIEGTCPLTDFEQLDEGSEFSVFRWLEEIGRGTAYQRITALLDQIGRRSGRELDDALRIHLEQEIGIGEAEAQESGAMRHGTTLLSRKLSAAGLGWRKSIPYPSGWRRLWPAHRGTKSLENGPA